jgi:hypothetical protein
MSFRLGNSSLKQFTKFCERADLDKISECIPDLDALLASGYLPYLESAIGNNPQSFVHICHALMDRQGELALRRLGIAGHSFVKSDTVKRWLYHAKHDHLRLLPLISTWSELNTPTLALAMSFLLNKDHYPSNPLRALHRAIPRLVLPWGGLWNYKAISTVQGRLVTHSENGLSSLWMTLARSHADLHSGLLSLLMCSYQSENPLQIYPAKALHAIYRENPDAARLAYAFWVATSQMDTWKTQSIPESIFWKGISNKQRQGFEDALQIQTLPLMLDILVPQWGNHVFSMGALDQDEYQEPNGHGPIDYIRMLEQTYKSVTAPMEPLVADFSFDF